MTVFSSLKAALRAGFKWYAYCPKERMHIVVLDRSSRRTPGARERCLAFAYPDADEMEAREAPVLSLVA